MNVPGGALAVLLFLSGTGYRLPGPLPLIQDPEEREVRALIEQLDSEDLAQRDRARQELTAKGRKIIPFLKPFLKASSAEVASQVKEIVERFEREERLERSLPTLRTVSLPKGRHTPTEILQQIREQTGYRVEAYGLTMGQPLEIGWDKAPVLQVLDDLCRQLKQGTPEPPFLSARSVDEFDFMGEPSAETPANQLVVNGEAKPPYATAHWNQFRAAVIDVVLTEQRSLHSTSTQALLTLAVSAQPGTHPVHVGSWEIVELVDDRGASLAQGDGRRAMNRGEPGPDVGESLDSVWFTMERNSHFGRQGQAPLSIKPPQPEARRITRMKLKLKVSFAVEELTRIVKVKDLKETGKETADFGRAGITFSKPEFEGKTFKLTYVVGGTSYGEPNVVLLDKDGMEMRNHGGGSMTSGAEHQRHWYLSGSTDIDAIRVSAWIGRKTIEIPFEFSDIPLPVER